MGEFSEATLGHTKGSTLLCTLSSVDRQRPMNTLDCTRQTSCGIIDEASAPDGSSPMAEPARVCANARKCVCACVPFWLPEEKASLLGSE